MNKLPSFKRLNLGAKKRVKGNWRKPHGIDSKQRQKLKAYGAIPDIGYRSKRSQRFLHPSGLEAVLVSNASQLHTLDVSKQCVRFSSTLGSKKRKMLEKIVKEKKLKLVN